MCLIRKIYFSFHSLFFFILYFFGKCNLRYFNVKLPVTLCLSFFLNHIRATVELSCESHDTH